VHKFKYRAPRFQVDLPVSLTMAGSAFSGRCREISRDGMRVEFAEPLPALATGIVSLTYRHISLEVPACVVRAGERQEGLRFRFKSDKQRDQVAELVGLLARSSAEPRPTLVK
jgi:PilZ domain